MITASLTGLSTQRATRPITTPAQVTIDANGNVCDLIDTTGSTVAHYEYSPFGQVASSTGEFADANPWQFSSKYYDAETHLKYYGYRMYSPELGRWLSRDPIGEEVHFRLYAFDKATTDCGSITDLGERLVCMYRSVRKERDVQRKATLHLYRFVDNDPYGHFDPDGRFIFVNPLSLAVCSWWTDQQRIAGTDAYLHCMTSCYFTRCIFVMDSLNALNAVSVTLIGGILHELIGDNTATGAIADIVSNIKGILGSLNPFQTCDDACKCEKGKTNPV